VKLKLFLLIAMCMPSSAAEFQVPPGKRITTVSPLDCKAISSTLVSEKDGKFQTQTNKGTDHLTIKRSGKTLLITAHHDNSGLSPDTDIYQITAESRDYLSAVQHTKLLPVVHGLVINKRLGTAIWTESDPEFIFVSEQPSSDIIVLDCNN